MKDMRSQDGYNRFQEKCLLCLLPYAIIPDSSSWSHWRKDTLTGWGESELRFKYRIFF
jgi:hypothetical protein